jgi:hypothetical protein
MKTRSMILASAAATLFAAGVGGGADTASAGHHEVKCEGVNACKGKSDCKTATSDCAGYNSCKGKGYKILSPEECEDLKAEMDDNDDE